MDNNTFAQRVLEAEPTLYRIAKSIMINESDCEDAVSEAILKGFEKLHTLKDEQYFKTWLVRILINQCYRQKRGTRQDIPYEDCIESTGAQDFEGGSGVYEQILALPARIRITVVLYYVEGYSVKEVKDILKIPEGTVKSRLAKGRELLKQAIS